jgi:hypothetical protein
VKALFGQSMLKTIEAKKALNMLPEALGSEGED